MGCKEMIIRMSHKASREEIDNVIKRLESHGLQVQEIIGQNCEVLGVVGDTSKISTSEIEALDHVEEVKRIQEPFKKANRKFNPQDTVIDINGIKIGGGHFAVMSGPCSVESEEQITGIAESIKASGAHILRGGAFKPRTSPYAFQGMRLEGLELLKKAREKTGLPVVTEIMSAEHLDDFVRDVDIIQVGARNMQNFELLKKLGKVDKPILLKRGLSATIEEWLMSAEYIMAGGNEKVILCERGIRTFEKYSRNTLDLTAIPIVKRLSHLPIVIDPSHAGGKYWMVEDLAKAATAAGADGLMIEVHNDPQNALSDGPQSLKPEKFEKVMRGINLMRKAYLESQLLEVDVTLDKKKDKKAI